MASSISRNVVTIPNDLIREILKRLPIKSRIRFCSVSKEWRRFITYATRSFFTIPTSPPKLIFTYQLDGITFFFSSPQTQDSFSLVADSHVNFPINCPSDSCRSVRGLVCGKYEQNVSKFYKTSIHLICNLRDGTFFILPALKSKRRSGLVSFFGYDPVDKVFKVLCMNMPQKIGMAKKHKILTLMSEGELLWKKIGCEVKHKPADITWKKSRVYDGICINGVIYYLGFVKYKSSFIPDIICFDLKTENFKAVNQASDMQICIPRRGGEPILLKFEGKFALRKTGGYDIELWVLLEADTHQWKHVIFNLDHLNFWTNVAPIWWLQLVGKTSTGEIVFSPNEVDGCFYLDYYNPKIRTSTRVDIQETGIFQRVIIYTFLDHM